VKKGTFFKRIRVAVSVIFLISFILLFLDFRRAIPEVAIRVVTWLQFVPSLLRFFNVFTLGAAGFFAVLFLTLIFGRIYCSAVCPLGILQDVITRLRKWMGKKKKLRYHYGKPHNFLRYGFLFLAFLSFFLGTVFLVNLLDPYSNFGRIFTFFAKPLLILLNNFLAGLLGKVNVYTLFTVEPRIASWGPALFQLGFLFLLIRMAAFHGRLYCNTVCPVGTLLGFLSRFSLFRIRIDKGSCTYCGLCSVACKSACIDTKQQAIDMSRCVTCFNCLPVCAGNSIVYGLPGLKKHKELKLNPVLFHTEKIDFGKREFLLKLTTFALGIAGISIPGKVSANIISANIHKKTKISDTTGVASGQVDKKIPVPTKLSTIPEKKEFPVSPPGSTGIEMFNNKCTACNLCVNACPTDVLQPAFLEFGLQGFMQPQMNYLSGFCNYECLRCLEICPTGAILPEPLEKKKLIQMGVAYFEKDNCIVKTEKTDCGACSEHCPTKAVHMIPFEGSLVIPETTDKLCIGCGACEFACPTTPYKAIYVDGNFIHKVAEKPKEVKLKPVNTEEDFPF